MQTRKSKSPINVFVVDDHPLFRHGLRRVIESEPDMAVCGEAANAEQTLDRIESCAPDVMIVDLCLAGRSGLDLVRDLKSVRPKLPVLMLSMYDESLYAERALRAGASGYVMKQQAAEEVIGAIRRIAQGHVHLSASLSSRMVRKAVEAPVGTPAATPERFAPVAPGDVGSTTAKAGVQQLSDRELEVFELLGQGLSTRRIAETLYRSVKTIESHRENIKAKLGVSSSAELLRYAVEHSLQLDTGAVRRGAPTPANPDTPHEVPGEGSLPPPDATSLRNEGALGFAGLRASDWPAERTGVHPLR